MSDASDSPLRRAGRQSNEAGRWRSLVAFAWPVLLGACAQHTPSPPDPEVDALQQRIQVLERRVEILEAQVSSLPALSPSSREEVDGRIRSLQSQRSALLERYTDAHPDVREIDRRLRLLRLQQEMLNQAGGPAK